MDSFVGLSQMYSYNVWKVKVDGKTMKSVATNRVFAYLKSKVIISQDQEHLSSKMLKSEQWPLIQQIKFLVLLEENGCFSFVHSLCMLYHTRDVFKCPHLRVVSIYRETNASEESYELKDSTKSYPCVGFYRNHLHTSRILTKFAH